MKVSFTNYGPFKNTHHELTYLLKICDYDYSSYHFSLLNVLNNLKLKIKYTLLIKMPPQFIECLSMLLLLFMSETTAAA
jgi:hypothetical protein